MIDGEDALMGCDADIPTVFLMPSSDAQAVEPILELRNAIILRAVNDYLWSVPWSYEEEKAMNFFKSDWFITLLSMDEAVGSVDPERLIRLLKKRKEKRVKFVKYL